MQGHRPMGAANSVVGGSLACGGLSVQGLESHQANSATDVVVLVFEPFVKEISDAITDQTCC